MGFLMGRCDPPLRRARIESVRFSGGDANTGYASRSGRTLTPPLYSTVHVLRDLQNSTPFAPRCLMIAPLRTGDLYRRNAEQP